MIYLPVSVHLSICLSVCLSIHPSAPFPIDNLSICSRKFFKFCIYIIIMNEWYGIVYGQNPSIYNRVTALVHTGKIVSGFPSVHLHHFQSIT